MIFHSNERHAKKEALKNTEKNAENTKLKREGELETDLEYGRGT